MNKSDKKNAHHSRPDSLILTRNGLGKPKTRQNMINIASVKQCELILYGNKFICRD